MTNIHADMRVVLREAFRQVFQREGTTSEMQCLQAVAWLETSYGRGWKPPGNGSNNLGACQAGSGWNGDTFSYTDTHPTSAGGNVPYVVKFRKYPTLVAGAVDLVKIVYLYADRSYKVLIPATKGDTLGFSAGLHASGYYEGFGATVAERIANHHKAVEASIRVQALAMLEDLPADLKNKPVPPPTLKQGSTDKSSVEILQASLNAKGARPPLTPDGSFGPATVRALKAFQGSHGLIPDGVCGPATWAALAKVSP